MPVDQIGFERANIQIWERINLIVFEEGRTENYTARIHDITPTEVVISTPMRGGVEIPLLNNTVVRVIIPCEAGFYSFSTVVLKKTISGVSVVHLQRPEVIERNQRRNYLRIPISLPVTYTILRPEDEKGGEGDAQETQQEPLQEEDTKGGEGDVQETQQEPLQGTAINIGGGGVGLEVKGTDGIEVGLEIALSFTIPGSKTSKTYEGVRARIVDITAHGLEKTPVLSVMFAEMNRKTQEEIIHFTIVRQLELIRAGKLTR